MTEDPIITKMKKISAMIKETKNDKLYYEFLNFYDDCVKSFRQELEESKKANLEAKKIGEQNSLKYLKLSHEVHDVKIESLHLANEASDRIINVIKPFFDELPNVTKAILNSPRISGLLLLLEGKGFVTNITKINFDQVIKDSLADTPSKEEVKK